MSLLGYDLNDVPDLQLLEEGEHELRIVKTEDKVSSKGTPMIAVQFEAVNEPNAATIFEYFTLPLEEDDERTRNNKLRRVKNMAICFSIPSMEINSWVGCTGFCAVRIEAGTDGYEDKNRIAKFLGAGR